MAKTVKPKPKRAATKRQVPLAGRRKKAAKKRKVKLTDQQKEQNAQMKEIRTLMENIGFSRVPLIDGKQFIYDSRPSELDDIFYYENIILLTEYTVGDPGGHLKEKKIIYDKINKNHATFLKFLAKEDKLKSLKDVLEKKILKNYSYAQLQIRILYASKKPIVKDHKDLVDDVWYFDYPIVKYFESISKTIKRSSKHEFFNFLGIEFSNIGENIKHTSTSRTDEFSGHILPEEHSSFKEGYKIISFYIDAESLIRRAYVLRRDGWQNKDSASLYQRMLLGKKIRSMRKYLHEQRRVFINNIIVTLPIEKIKVFDEKGTQVNVDAKGNFVNARTTRVTPTQITIENVSNIIGIIDGQHRTYAYHEGDDVYEKTIAQLRRIQNLLITGILYPKEEIDEKRLKFEAQLFLEINANQQGASSRLKQDIEFMMHPFSTIAISKHVLNKLNESGPLGSMFEEYWFENSKLKTASIISFGLRPVVKLDGNDCLFKVWENTKKDSLKKTESYALLKEYKNFCVEEVRNIFIGLKDNIDRDDWKMDRSATNAILNVTTVNGVINCLRILIENGKNGDVAYYRKHFVKIKGFNFKGYKSSQYRQMGLDIYERCFN